MTYEELQLALGQVTGISPEQSKRLTLGEHIDAAYLIENWAVRGKTHELQARYLARFAEQFHGAIFGQSA